MSSTPIHSRGGLQYGFFRLIGFIEETGIALIPGVDQFEVVK